MSDTLDRLRASSDPIDIELAEVLEHWQSRKRTRGEVASLGYEPRDLARYGTIELISNRVVNSAIGFQEVDRDLSYEAIVVRHRHRFDEAVVVAAEKRLEFGTQVIDAHSQQDIQFIIKTSRSAFFGADTEASKDSKALSAPKYLGSTVHIPSLLKKDVLYEPLFASPTTVFVWFHEEPQVGEPGKGLTGIVRLSPLSDDRSAIIEESVAFRVPLGSEIFGNTNNSPLINAMDGYRLNRVWPVSKEDVSLLLDLAANKAKLVDTYNQDNPDQRTFQLVTGLTGYKVLREVVVRAQQRLFRKSLLAIRANSCAITGTIELQALDAAHIVPFKLGSPDSNDPKNGLLLRKDIHALFDNHLISINPRTKRVEISTLLTDETYTELNGVTITDDVLQSALEIHYSRYKQKKRPRGSAS